MWPCRGGIRVVGVLPWRCPLASGLLTVLCSRTASRGRGGPRRWPSGAAWACPAGIWRAASCRPPVSPALRALGFLSTIQTLPRGHRDRRGCRRFQPNLGLDWLLLLSPGSGPGPGPSFPFPRHPVYPPTPAFLSLFWAADAPGHQKAGRGLMHRPLCPRLHTQGEKGPLPSLPSAPLTRPRSTRPGQVWGPHTSAEGRSPSLPCFGPGEGESHFPDLCPRLGPWAHPLRGAPKAGKAPEGGRAPPGTLASGACPF